MFFLVPLAKSKDMSQKPGRDQIEQALREAENPEAEIDEDNPDEIPEHCETRVAKDKDNTAEDEPGVAKSNSGEDCSSSDSSSDSSEETSSKEKKHNAKSKAKGKGKAKGKANANVWERSFFFFFLQEKTSTTWHEQTDRFHLKF